MYAFRNEGISSADHRVTATLTAACIPEDYHFDRLEYPNILYLIAVLHGQSVLSLKIRKKKQALEETLIAITTTLISSTVLSDLKSFLLSIIAA